MHRRIFSGRVFPNCPEETPVFGPFAVISQKVKNFEKKVLTKGKGRGNLTKLSDMRGCGARDWASGAKRFRKKSLDKRGRAW